MKMLAVSLTLCTVLAISQAIPINPTMSWDKGHCYHERMNCSNLIGSFCPKCDDNGNFLPRQCSGSTGYCWCVDIMTGKKIPNTTTPPDTPPVNCMIGDSDCPDGWSRFGDRCFNYISTPKTWTEAQIFCQFDGGNLASIHNYEENHFVQSLTRGDTDNFPETWAGATSAVHPGFWMWIDGSKFYYEDWCDDDDHDDTSEEDSHDNTNEEDSHGKSSKKDSHDDTSEEDSHGKSSKKDSHDDTSEEDSHDDTSEQDSHGKSSKKDSHDDTSEQDSEDDDDHDNTKKTASICMKINCHYNLKWCTATCNDAFPFVCSKRI
uniref:Uncharacterized LOC101466519 n=1 Tax=Maylandia zebra TaxID=106582 RepID=A0A3P9DT90_9CICH|nr:uncharacterized protein LOC101466519 [Maylandia zebra]